MDSFGLADTAVTPPAISISSPLDGATVSGTVPIAASIIDPGQTPIVEFRVNDSTVGVVTSAPYTLPWNSASVPNGSATIEVVSLDYAGGTATSSIAVSVGN